MVANHASTAPQASADEIRQILGKLEEEQLLEILALHPTVLDLEEASMCIAGDRDVFGGGDPVREPVGAIVAIVVTDQNEDERRKS